VEAAVQLEYDALPDHYDEMLAGPGEPRTHWMPFVRSVGDLGQEELGRRWEQAQRLIHENGVTYNVYGDPRGMDRPWELDPFPLVLSNTEWERLSTALAQRARLLNRLLVDLYGPQRLLHEGLIPAELVFAHPGFLRSCHGMPVPEDGWLALYAADLARSADGQWWVIADRTQAPSGAGYALENRIVLSRAFPEAFRDSQVERLAGFFVRLRETLRHLARQSRRDNPRIALLTPGPYNETYFEHAYLARYLGFTLVEGADLTVRDRALYLKTLGGLERVDVLLRRVDDGFCDPLSLRSDSSLGVAGLVHAARAGNVVVANALGSGLVESPALMAFLPSLCRTVLGEELLLPSVATWWCGHPEALTYVLDHLDGLVVKPFSGHGMEPVFGARLSTAEREAFLAHLRGRPHAFVAQEQVALSTAPVWDGRATQPRHIVLRAYCVASDDSYEVMPGGLTRAAVSQDSLVVSMQRGGGSKDTWVRTEDLVNPVSLLQPAGAPIELTRGGAELPSRVADNLFWLGRYAERAEGAARFARGILARLSDESAEAVASVLPLLVALARHAGQVPDFFTDEKEPEAAERNTGRSLERRLLSFLFEDESPRSLRATLHSIHQLAFSLRDQISIDTWRVLSGLQAEWAPSEATRSISATTAGEILNRTIVLLSAWSGLTMESMTRGQGWRFADMGRRIERGGYTATLLASTLVQVRDEEARLLEGLLETAESAITYRRRYFGELQTTPVLDLLLTDETNPRSLAFQLAALHEHVERLPRTSSRADRSGEQRIALAALGRVRLADVAALARRHADGKRLQLEELLGRLSDELLALSDSNTRSFHYHAESLRRVERF
jgi:uncharacterized circularly permuted ATP-grasp superfamily protein/uncharacterized alpha-E superfamily protein